ncbi:transcriptional regulator with XRE-family HTH domain [Sporosarcina luteola]|nr:transcriptional regulator with XRE-family HTH domain [Sporosarcina luteola]
MNVGSIVKYYRMKHNLTQAELCEGICSISHLSKIESNKYVPHQETLEELFTRMNIEWNQEVDVYLAHREKLEKFITYSVYYDLKSMEALYAELERNRDYLQSTDLINRYELYKLRYYLFQQNRQRATQQMRILAKLESTFDEYERGAAKVFYLIYYVSTRNKEKAKEIVGRIEDSQGWVPQLFEGEFYYQNAWLSQRNTEYGKSSYFAELAINQFQKDCNYLRLMHAQMLQAVNYANRDLYLQAEGLFKTLLRNARLMDEISLYEGVLYNYSMLQNRRGHHKSAYLLLKELKSLITPEIPLYASVLIHMLQTAAEEGLEMDHLLEELEILLQGKDDPYLTIQLNYFRKLKFSQRDLFDYCEQIVFPFLKEHGYIGEARRFAWRLANYYRSIGHYEKADEYAIYFYEKGEKMT